MYHSLLAILYKFGYESKNHECTINAVEYLIEIKKVNLDMENIAFIRTTEQMKEQEAKSFGKNFSMVLKQMLIRKY